MKSLLNLFYTRAFKIILSVLLFVAAYFVGECQLEYFHLYNEDRISFRNAVVQIDSFDYENSYYMRETVETTVEDIVILSTDYSDIFEKAMSAEEFIEYYVSIGDSKFLEIYDSLKSVSGIRFAFVNHTDKIIYSNIEELNGQPNSADVRRHFGAPGKNLMIARSCKTPYFETNTFIRYADYVRELAEKYNINFDLYIYFGDEASFNADAKRCEDLHFSMRRQLEKLNDTIAVLIAVVVFLGLCLVAVTGRREYRGKVYPSFINRLPNDLIVIIFTTVLGCIVSIYRTAFYMVITYEAQYDNFWFTRSESFYTNRIHICIIVFRNEIRADTLDAVGAGNTPAQQGGVRRLYGNNGNIEKAEIVIESIAPMSFVLN